MKSQDWRKIQPKTQSLPGGESRGKLIWQLLAHANSDGAIAEQIAPVPEEEEPEEIRQRRLEAILLMAREPLPSRRLAQLTGLADATEARTLTRRLNERYDQSGRAMRIEEVAGGFQMVTRPQFAKWLRRLEHVPGEERLTQPSLETLALVAYRQPILRSDLEAIRGVGCGEVLRQLMQRDLVRICGRSEELGRPYLYGTTRRFLQLFGLQTIERLPRAEWVRQVELMRPALRVDNQVSAPGQSSGVGLEDVSPSSLFGSETKESTVKMTVAANGLKETLDELIDPRLSPRFNTLPLVASDEDEMDDDDYEDDDDEEDDDFEDDEEFEDEEEFEDDEEDEEELDEEFEEEGDDEWEEVEGDEEEEDEEEDEEWDDEEDDDWDDDEEDAEEEEEEDWD